MLSDDEAFCSGDEACGATKYEPFIRTSCSVAATMSASTHNAVSLHASMHFSKKGAVASEGVQGKQKTSAFLRSAGKKDSTLGLNLTRGRARLICGTSGLALWTFFIVFWICNAMPDLPHGSTRFPVKTFTSSLPVLVMPEHSDGVRDDLGGETMPFITLLLLGALLLAILLAYGATCPHGKATTKTRVSKLSKVKSGTGSAPTPKKFNFGKMVGKNTTRKVSFDLEANLSTPDSSVILTQDSSVRCASSDVENDGCDKSDGFVSCDECSDSEDTVVSGPHSICGFFIDEEKLPEHVADCNYESLVMDIHRRCSVVADLSMDQCLRLSLGLNFDIPAIIKKWGEVHEWRGKYDMANEHVRCIQLQRPFETEVISFPHQDEIYTKVFNVRPCAFVSRAGEPVSLWLIGTGSSSASSVPVDRIEEWSRSVFEYTSTWAQTQSKVTGRILGQIQVFDMSSVGFRHMTNSALHERFKRALGCGSNYVELVSHIYVINSSWSFSKVWNIVKPLISKRTSSKVTVSTNVPDELMNILTSESSKALREILTTSGRSVVSKVQRPPGQQHEDV